MHMIRVCSTYVYRCVCVCVKRLPLARFNAHFIVTMRVAAVAVDVADVAAARVFMEAVMPRLSMTYAMSCERVSY